ncbi:hypothetical protein [Bergeyella zoohelcum]|uniref:Lipopolysaccharide assembly protein A domain-containing protein n=1 Tax=Bergeyella zoohelcum ATCC 43767 TaxID=883096 RepID=K1M3S9_9FLAO|nr:hypothetical protein [Bergeyella zoohelcum]EKB58912.1 hypothetical protein HMPREF9699_00457 [Bergeyella zoohelcum ATCC 43767]SUV49354.1 Uncharacterised protein [Bergeyella zoohelcum]
MKNLTLIGAVLLGLAALLYFLQESITLKDFFSPLNLMGILAGVGIGLIVGGIVGYVSKGSAIKEKQKKAAYLQLQKEKQELEKQAAELAMQSQKETNHEMDNKI